MKAVLIVLDGLGDVPVNGKTPLSAARKPNIDAFCRKAQAGQLHTLGRGLIPGSDTAHLALLGYDPAASYHGRGPLEALGAGMKIDPGDVAFRANFARIEDGIITDRRAGRVPRGGDKMAEMLTMEAGGFEFIVHHTVQHRCALVIRGEGTSPSISDTDPHMEGVAPLKCKPLGTSPDAMSTSTAVNLFSKQAFRVLTENKMPANYVLLRGAGAYKKVPSMKERFGITAACITGGALYKGVARYVGMDVPDVPGATGDFSTNLAGKAKAVQDALRTHDFVFAHIKATDNASHDGDFEKKRKVIERVDAEFFKPLASLKDTIIVLTGDHSTPVSKKRHTSDPCPILVGGPGVRADAVKKFDETSVMQGGLGHILGMDIMPMLLDLLDKSKIVGS